MDENTLENMGLKRTWADPHRFVRNGIVFYQGDGTWCEGVAIWGAEAIEMAKFRNAKFIIAIGPRTPHAWSELTEMVRNEKSVQLECTWIEFTQEEERRIQEHFPHLTVVDMIAPVSTTKLIETWEKLAPFLATKL